MLNCLPVVILQVLNQSFSSHCVLLQDYDNLLLSPVIKCCTSTHTTGNVPPSLFIPLFMLPVTLLLEIAPGFSPANLFLHMGYPQGCMVA